MNPEVTTPSKVEPGQETTGMSRRGFLRSTGALVALPFMESLLPRSAFAAPKTVGPPLRMGIFTVTGGTVLESWVPEQVGPLGKLPSILRPLQPLADDLTIVSGLSQSGKVKGTNAHEACAYVHLTCPDEVSKNNGKISMSLDGGADVESIDQVAGRLVAKDSLLPSLEIGMSSGETRYSFREGGVPVPYESKPRLLYERMFRGRKPVMPNWNKRGASLTQAASSSNTRDSYEKSVVDLVLEEAKALKKYLGRSDQEKLEQYLTSIRSIEERIAKTEARLAMEGMAIDEPGPGELHNADYERDFDRKMVVHDPDVHAEYIRLMSDMMVLAFQTDTTRVVTLALGSDGALFPGVVTVGYERHAHTLEHQGNSRNIEDADPISREGCRQIHAFYTALFAETIAKMKAIDEGGTSLLDNSMILYTSYMADGGHGRRNYPCLFAGNAQGTIKTGQHIAVEEHTPIANIYVEMLTRMGDTTGKFGNSHSCENARFDGRIPGLGIA